MGVFVLVKCGATIVLVLLDLKLSLVLKSFIVVLKVLLSSNHMKRVLAFGVVWM